MLFSIIADAFISSFPIMLKTTGIFSIILYVGYALGEHMDEKRMKEATMVGGRYDQESEVQNDDLNINLDDYESLESSHFMNIIVHILGGVGAFLIGSIITGLSVTSILEAAILGVICSLITSGCFIVVIDSIKKIMILHYNMKG